MKNLRKSRILFFFILMMFYFGCKSLKTFEMTTLDSKEMPNELHVIEVDTNRIIQECYFLNAEKENQWRHLYILNILNDKNEVISVFNPTTQEKEQCIIHLNEVDKILKKSTKVKLCVRDKFKLTQDQTFDEIYNFGQLGSYKSPYDGLTFDRICNEKKCYGISDTWIYSCPELY